MVNEPSSELQGYLENELQDQYGMSPQDARTASYRQMDHLGAAIRQQPVSGMSQEYLTSVLQESVRRHAAVKHVPPALARDMVSNPQLAGSVFRHPVLTQAPKTHVGNVVRLPRRVR